MPRTAHAPAGWAVGPHLGAAPRPAPGVARRLPLPLRVSLQTSCEGVAEDSRHEPIDAISSGERKDVAVARRGAARFGVSHQPYG